MHIAPSLHPESRLKRVKIVRIVVMSRLSDIHHNPRLPDLVRSQVSLLADAVAPHLFARFWGEEVHFDVLDGAAGPKVLPETK